MGEKVGGARDTGNKSEEMRPLGVETAVEAISSDVLMLSVVNTKLNIGVGKIVRAGGVEVVVVVI